MTSIVLEGPIAEARERTVRLLQAIADILAQMGTEHAEDRRRLQQNAADLQEMFFLVVVVGEFNAGKSTFINALLGDELIAHGVQLRRDATAPFTRLIATQTGALDSLRRDLHEHQQPC